MDTSPEAFSDVSCVYCFGLSHAAALSRLFLAEQRCAWNTVKSKEPILSGLNLPSGTTAFSLSPMAFVPSPRRSWPISSPNTPHTKRS